MKKARANREFNFTRSDFEALSKMVRSHTGIVLSDQKFDMAYGRIARRLRHYGLKDATDYLSYVQTEDGAPELINFVNAMTTNLTSFFRENHHFELMRDIIHADWGPALRRGTRKRLRIWSAGCSSGEEPYSIASTLKSTFGSQPLGDTLILATDIDTNMLARGEAGLYKREDLEKSGFAKQFYKKAGPDQGEMSDDLKKLIRFKQLNLLEKWPFKGPFDVIFCRNVLIYFDAQTRAKLGRRYKDLLAPGGVLFLGHSEVLTVDGLNMETLGRSAFRKKVNETSVNSSTSGDDGS